MNSEISIEQRTMQALHEDDNVKLEEVFNEIIADFNGRNFNEIVNSIIDMKIPFKDRIEFILKADSFNNDENATVFYELLPYAMSKCIEQYPDEFIYIISKDEKLQSMAGKYFKQFPTEMMKAWKGMANLPKIKEIVLDDEQFISKNMESNINFFSNLPREYGYLITLYNARDNRFLGNITNLYSNYFTGIISDEEINELISLHAEINSEPNMLRLSTKDKMRELEYVLKETIKDEQFFKKMKLIGNKCNLELRELIVFTYKYADTDLYRQLQEGEVTSDVVQKIKYLASEGKIEQIKSLDDIYNVSMEELQKMDKQRKTVIQSRLRGGPNSDTMQHIFPDSESREVRRIDQNGEFRSAPVITFENHEDAVERVYEDSIQFPEDCTDAISRCREAAKQLHSVTFVIENEQCFIYVPDDISERQKEVCKKWLGTAIEESKIGIFIYDRKEDKTDIANEDTMDKDTALKFILDINHRDVEDMDR